MSRLPICLNTRRLIRDWSIAQSPRFLPTASGSPTAQSKSASAFPERQLPETRSRGSYPASGSATRVCLQTDQCGGSIATSSGGFFWPCVHTRNANSDQHSDPSAASQLASRKPTLSRSSRGVKRGLNRKRFRRLLYRLFTGCFGDVWRSKRAPPANAPAGRG